MAEEETGAVAEPGRSGVSTARRGGIVIFALVLVVAALGHAFGASVVMLIVIGLAVLALGALYLKAAPKLRGGRRGSRGGRGGGRRPGGGRPPGRRLGGASGLRPGGSRSKPKGGGTSGSRGRVRGLGGNGGKGPGRRLGGGRRSSPGARPGAGSKGRASLPSRAKHALGGPRRALSARKNGAGPLGGARRGGKASLGAGGGKRRFPGGKGKGGTGPGRAGGKRFGGLGGRGKGGTGPKSRTGSRTSGRGRSGGGRRSLRHPFRGGRAGTGGKGRAGGRRAAGGGLGTPPRKGYGLSLMGLVRRASPKARAARRAARQQAQGGRRFSVRRAMRWFTPQARANRKAARTAAMWVSLLTWRQRKRAQQAQAGAQQRWIQPPRHDPADAAMPRPAAPVPQANFRPPTPLTPSAGDITMADAPVTPIQSATEAIQQVIGGYEPANLMSAGQVFPDMKKFYEGLATSIDSLADTLDESPMHGDLVANLREQVSALAGLRDQAEEGEGQFQKLHEDDINRIENPRQNEQMADFQAHQ